LVEARDYLSRIDTRAPNGATPKVLRELQVAHLQAVPFENLDIHLGIEIVLEPERILRKIVTDRRGGFCYELNYGFHWLLTEIGYNVTLVSAEVARPEGGFGIPFDHMTLLVETEGERWLADVGFGDSFLYPLLFVADEEHEEPEFRYRLRPHEGYWHLERASREGGDFEVQYRFTTTPRRLEDFRAGCAYHQSSPESTFTQKVVATRALPGGRVTVTRDRILLRQGKNRSETPLADEGAWRDALARHLGIHLESSTRAQRERSESRSESRGGGAPRQ
jgi:N-hydroxyarylamine O-acetyltransferase